MLLPVFFPTSHFPNIFHFSNVGPEKCYVVLDAVMPNVMGLSKPKPRNFL